MVQEPYSFYLSYHTKTGLLLCIVLCCVLVWCGVLYCIVLYCIVLCRIMLYCVVLYCIVLHYTLYNVIQDNIITIINTNEQLTNLFNLGEVWPWRQWLHLQDSISTRKEHGSCSQVGPFVLKSSTRYPRYPPPPYCVDWLSQHRHF